MTKNHSSVRNRLAALVLALSLVLAVAGCGPKEITMPSAGHSVADRADILSPETEALVDQYSGALQAATGAQIGVLTLTDTGKAKLSEYAGDAYQAWGIGDAKKKNGALLVLVTGNGGNYWCVQGKGLAKQLPGEEISTLLNTYLEPGFAVSDFDGGVTAFVDALAREMAGAEGVTLSLEQQGTAGFDGARAEKSTVKHLLLLAGLFLVLFVVLLCAALLGVGTRKNLPSRRTPPVRSAAAQAPHAAAPRQAAARSTARRPAARSSRGAHSAAHSSHASRRSGHRR